jgi:hypothetical protein
MRHARTCTIVGTLALLAATAAHSAPRTDPLPPGADAFVRDRHLTRYAVGLADLNGDKRPEALVYAMATTQGGGTADLCGSGGCDLYVLALDAKGYRKISTITLTRPPIRMLAQTTHGWHDLSVVVAGGGIGPAYEARLRFDGARYPGNPTVPPATRRDTGPGKAAPRFGKAVRGSIVIAAIPGPAPAAHK